MNIDLHSHFFPIEALQNPGKYEDRAPKLVLDRGKLSVTSQIGFRPGLGAGAYDPVARIKALDEMQIDLQAISPSPILLFYWEAPAIAAHFSRKQNEAIQAVVQKHPDRFVGFGSVPLQSVEDSIAIAEEAKSLGLRGLEIGNAVGEKPLDDPSFEAFFEAAQRLDMLLFVHPLEGGLDADDPLSPVLGNVLQFTFRTTMMVERMILERHVREVSRSAFVPVSRRRIARLQHLAPRSFIWPPAGVEADHSTETIRVSEKALLRHHRSFGFSVRVFGESRRAGPSRDRYGLSHGDGRLRAGEQGLAARTVRRGTGAAPRRQCRRAL